MIKNKEDYKRYLLEDYRRQGMKYPFLASITYGEHSCTWAYIKALRRVEYYSSQRGRNVVFKMLYYASLMRYRRQCLKKSMYIMPNTVEEGLLLPHPGFVRVGSFCRIGKNCTILPMVLFGKKKPGIDCIIEVGDNCYVSTGVTILGPVKIGNNVTIAAGAVVTSDIPDNSVVAGVPAKIVKKQ